MSSKRSRPKYKALWLASQAHVETLKGIAKSWRQNSEELHQLLAVYGKQEAERLDTGERQLRRHEHAAVLSFLRQQQQFHTDPYAPVGFECLSWKGEPGHVV